MEDDEADAGICFGVKHFSYEGIVRILHDVSQRGLHHSVKFVFPVGLIIEDLESEESIEVTIA